MRTIPRLISIRAFMARVKRPLFYKSQFTVSLAKVGRASLLQLGQSAFTARSIFTAFDKQHDSSALLFCFPWMHSQTLSCLCFRVFCILPHLWFHLPRYQSPVARVIFKLAVHSESDHTKCFRAWSCVFPFS